MADEMPDALSDGELDRITTRLRQDEWARIALSSGPEPLAETRIEKDLRLLLGEVTRLRARMAVLETAAGCAKQLLSPECAAEREGR